MPHVSSPGELVSSYTGFRYFYPKRNFHKFRPRKDYYHLDFPFVERHTLRLIVKKTTCRRINSGVSRLKNIGGILVLLLPLGGFLWWNRIQEHHFIQSLPDEKGKSALISHCTSCHNLEPVFQSPNSTPEQWEKTILWMQKMQGMPPIDQKDKSEIIHYLTTYEPKNDY